MRGLARALAREPLVHFCVLGALLLGAEAWLGVGDAPPAETIHVTPELSATLDADFARQRGRAPTTEEHERLLERWLDDEVLFREAVRQGLSDGDPVVRRRLIERVRYLLEATLTAPEPAPTDTELAAYLSAHAERYATGRTTSLTHVFVREPARAPALLNALREGADPARLGDPFPHPRVIRAATDAQLASRLGDDFAQDVADVEPGAWSGPLESTYGTHLVRIDARTAGRAGSLGEADVREAVRRDLVRDRRSGALTERVRELRARYRVLVGDGP